MAMETESKIKFDPTINLGHLLTFIGFIVSGFLAYQSMDKRIAILEENKKTQELRDQFQDSQNMAQNNHIQNYLSEIKRSIEKLDGKFESIRNDKR